MSELLAIVGSGILDLVAFLVFLGMLVVIVSIVVLLVRAFRAGKNCGN